MTTHPPLLHADDRPTWIEVDGSAIAHNVRRLVEIAAPAQVLAVVKADGYGHSSRLAARAALDGGARWLGVAYLSEAQRLREAGFDAPMLVMGYTAPWQAPTTVALDLRVTLFSMDVARALSEAAASRGTTARVHVKVDTGMHRLGVEPDEVVAFVRAVQQFPAIEVEGLFTHFSCADCGDCELRDYTAAQLATFLRVREAVREAGITEPLFHAANSAGTLAWPEARLDMVRPGIAMYGIAPSEEVPLPTDFRPALTWKTQVVQVRSLTAGALVGYSARYRTTQPEVIATLPVGYADGFRRTPHNWGEVLVRGQRAPIVGTVCMDQVMINVTAIPDVRVGDEVVLIGAQDDACITADDVAARLGTNGYEVVAAILPRVTRH